MTRPDHFEVMPAQRPTAHFRSRGPNGTFRAVRARGSPLTAFLAVAGLLVGVATSTRAIGEPAVGSLPLWSAPLLFLAAEVHARLGRGVASTEPLSAGAAAIALSLLGVSPWIVVPSAVGSTLAVALCTGDRNVTGLLRRCATASLAASAGVAAFGLASGGAAGARWEAAVAASFAAAGASLAIALLAEGLPVRQSGDGRYALGLAVFSVAGGAGLAAAGQRLLEGPDPATAALLVLPFVATAVSSRLQERSRQRLAQLDGLQDSLHLAYRAHGAESEISHLLMSTMRLVDGDIAWLTLLPRGTNGRLSAERTHERMTNLGPVELSAGEEALLHRAALASGPVAVAADACSPAEEASLLLRGAANALLIALRGDRGLHGVLMVGRGSGRPAFDGGDLRLFQTFAAHAGLMLENESLERSVSELKILKEELRHRAYHDTLTGLANRTLFYELVSDSLATSVAGSRIAVFFLDLDDFKVVNDTLGHEAGDALLAAVAGRINGVTRPMDTAARLGGDEFAVLSRVRADHEADAIAERLAEALRAPFSVAGKEFTVHSSIGIAIGEKELTAEEILRNADVAMYAAKRDGKGGFARFEEQMHVDLRERHETMTALTRSVSRGEILVHYQPIVEIGSGRLVALEALARWRRPGHPLVGPGDFIDLADEIGLMSEIGSSVLREACEQVRSWQRAFPEHADLTVSVNLAPSELHDPALVGVVERALSRAGLDPERLMLEITESGVMRRPQDALRTMTSLRELGVALALDDFGTGHSSLAHVRDFPMDVLKIAQPFIARLPRSDVDATFVETIMRLASSLDLHVIAEGIETFEQARALERMGCTYGQGFLYGEPAGDLGVTDYLAARSLPASTILAA